MQRTMIGLMLDRTMAGQVLEAAQSQGRQFITEPEAKRVLQAYGVPTPRGHLCLSLEEATSAAREIGYPVAMKIVSPKIIHKTELGGVRVNIVSDEDLRNAHSEMMAAVTASISERDIQGVLVEEMAHGHELIIGASRDQQFGPLVMFGIGGVFVEILKDVSYRLAPLDTAEAREMIREIKGYPLLAGTRGGKPVNEEALVDVLVRVSRLVDDFREIKELDLNPTFAEGDSIVAADARIIVD